MLALVWSSVLHAPRRHCLEALYKIEDKLEMRQMDITKDMRTTKHLLEKKTGFAHQREGFRTRWHRARDVGAISAKGSQSGYRRNCEVKCRKLGQMIQQEAPNEAELDWEVSQLQPGERRRGISAWQSTYHWVLPQFNHSLSNLLQRGA